MTVLRWWFAVNYDVAALAARHRQVFTLKGQGVKVESENEQLTAQGQQVHQRQHPTVMWAKFEALVQGARLASERLWG